MALSSLGFLLPHIPLTWRERKEQPQNGNRKGATGNDTKKGSVKPALSREGEVGEEK